MKHLDTILTKMHEMVGCEYNGIPTESDWYVQNKWTQEQGDEFIEWMTGYLMNDSGARREMMRWPYKVKRNCLKAAKQFVYIYGWTIEQAIIIYGLYTNRKYDNNN